MRILFLIIATLSFSFAETTMVKDPSTNLLWEDTQHVSEDKITHAEAKAYCAALKLGEVSVWRLPTIHELLSIVDYKRFEPATLKEFNHIKVDSSYWTSTPYLRSKDKFWDIDFKDGATDSSSANYNRHVRCVKDSK